MAGARARKLASGWWRSLAIIALSTTGTLSAIWLFAAEWPSSKPSLRTPPWDATADAASPVSDEFRQRIEAAAATVPSKVWQSLWEAGWRVQMAEFVVDAAPTLMGEQPRGWPDGLTWENTDAVNLPQRRLVVVAEKRRNRQGEVVSTWRAEGVFRHELGHAYDRVGSDGEAIQSAHPHFLAAYHQDAQTISPADRVELGYYLQNRAAGRQEAYAEAFAILLGGGSDPSRRDIFVRAFPRVVAYVEQSLTEQPALAQAPGP